MIHQWNIVAQSVAIEASRRIWPAVDSSSGRAGSSSSSFMNPILAAGSYRWAELRRRHTRVDAQLEMAIKDEIIYIRLTLRRPFSIWLSFRINRHDSFKRPKRSYVHITSWCLSSRKTAMAIESSTLYFIFSPKYHLGTRNISILVTFLNIFTTICDAIDFNQRASWI